MVVAFALSARPVGQGYLAVEPGVNLHFLIGLFQIGADPRDADFGLIQLALQLAFTRDCLLERGGAAARVVERLQRGLGFGEPRFDVAEFFNALRNFVALPLFRFAFYGYLSDFRTKDPGLTVDSFGLARL